MKRPRKQCCQIDPPPHPSSRYKLNFATVGLRDRLSDIYRDNVKFQTINFINYLLCLGISGDIKKLSAGSAHTAALTAQGEV